MITCVKLWELVWNMSNIYPVDTQLKRKMIEQVIKSQSHPVTA